MKTLKTTLFALTLVASTFSFSQEKTKKTPEQRAVIHTEKMAKQLLLSPEQKEKTLVLNTGIAQKNEAIRSNASLTQEQKKEALKGNHDAHMSQMKSILNEEQFKKLQAIEARKKAQHEKQKQQKQKLKQQKNKANEKANEVEELEEEL